ncbi:MAG: prepilin peptidase [Gammaproteobacteria bacterium]
MAPSDLQALLTSHAELVYAGIVVFALIIGSFLNVVILRLPVMMDRAWRQECRAVLDSPEISGLQGEVSLIYPPSTCPHCSHRIRPLENIPVVSWLAMRGRCSACNERVSIRYPLVETLSAVLAVAVIWKLGLIWQAGAALLFTWALLALTVIDLDHQLLPDSITLPLLWLGLVINAHGTFVPLASALWGAVFGYLTLWSVYWAFKLATGKEGMGFGDFKLLAALGAWTGWMALPTIVLLSSFLGAVAGICMMAFRGMSRGTPFPFGPFLAAAGWVTLLWGSDLQRYWP